MLNYFAKIASYFPSFFYKPYPVHVYTKREEIKNLFVKLVKLGTAGHERLAIVQKDNILGQPTYTIVL